MPKIKTDQPEAAAPTEATAAAEVGTPCKFQLNRDTIVDAVAFGIDVETGRAERVEIIGGAAFNNVRQGPTQKGNPDCTGSFELSNV